MKLNKILENIEYEVVQGNMDIDIKDISYDSRRVKCGTLFVCILGLKMDGHDYIMDAVSNGALAVVIQNDVSNLPKNTTVIRVSDIRTSLPIISSTFYEDPSRSMDLIGITGTNGKTSVAFIISSILESAQRKTGLIGTIENGIGNKVLDVIRTTPTTPESLELQLLLKKMKDENVSDVVMEVSSMALELHRVEGLDFEIGVFTNLSQDHLDDHKTFENYKNAKMKLFKMCKNAIINIDDSTANEIIKNCNCNVITYGIENKADIIAKDIKISSNGVTFTINFKENEYIVNSKIPGKFSVYNALSAVAACHCLGLSIEQIVEGLEQIHGVKGRFQTIQAELGYSVIIDYAHTPNAIENVLNTIIEFKKGKVITVFGCGGNRDNTKRPIMGEIAGKLSDFCIITSDSPRNEEPAQIIKDVEDGIKKTGCSYTVVEDRKEAILFSLENAQNKDVILIVGKGHENYQIIKDKVIPFDDAQIVGQYLEQKSM